MEIVQFKTNINCSSCVARIAPTLDKEAAIQEWKVDTLNPKKILTVEKEGITTDQIMAAVKHAGFNIELLEH